MFRNNISVYVRTEEIAQKVRAYAQRLNQEQGARPYIKSVPQTPSQTTNNPVYATTQEPRELHLSTDGVNMLKMPKLPPFLLEVMNGGTFPQPEDLTKAEQAILYDNQINTLVNLYRQTKNQDLAQHIRERLDELGVDF